MMSKQTVQDDRYAVEVVIQRTVAEAALHVLQDLNGWLGRQGRTLAITHRFDDEVSHDQRHLGAVVVANSRGLAFRIGTQRYTVNGSRSGYWGNVKQIAACLWWSSTPTAFGTAW